MSSLRVLSSTPRIVFPAALVLLSLSAGARANTLLLPGLANTAGQNGTRFSSSVFVVNPGARDAAVTFALIPAAGVAVPRPVVRTLRSGETLAFSNALAELFGLEGTFGTLAVTSDDPLALRGTTANVKDPAATYGVSLAAVDSGAALLPGETGHAIWLSNSPDLSRGYRTNVNVSLLAPDSEVVVTLWDDSGFVRGSARIASPAPVTWQASTADLAADPDLATGRVTFEVLRGRATGYTAVVDNVTGDGIAVLAERAPSGPGEFLLDGVARASGLNGTHWSTDFRLFNPGREPLSVTLEPDGLPAAATRTVTLGPRSLAEIADVLGAGGFALGDGVAGAIRLRASSPFLATGRTRNADPTLSRPGGFSAEIRAIPWTSGLTPAGREAILAGLTHSGSTPGFRTNVALLGGAAGASGRLVLRDAAGGEVAASAFTLGPSEWRQQSLPGWFGAPTAPPGSRVDVAVETGALDAYASVIDNVTGDAVVAPALPKPPPCVVPAIAVVSVSPGPPSAPGQAVTLFVSAVGATSIRVEPGGLVPGAAGTVTVSPSVTTTYRLFAENACGTATSAVTLEVAAAPAVVATASGALRGVISGGAAVYKGIPYAAPPLGPLRLRPPVAADSWSWIRDASGFGNICPQLDDSGRVVGSEDCLVLNVWSPAVPDPAPAPVLFWIHGGGNVEGAGSLAVYDGQAFVEQNGLVVVTLNYRLGALGFLAHPALDAESARGVSGNYGLLDQVAALGWVRRNIAAFGGDPARVLIAGESAGAVDVCSLLASPLARGLFARALMESGGCSQPPLSSAEAFGETIVEAAGCAGAPDVAACLRALSAEALTSAVPPQSNVSSSSGQLYGPNVDGFVLDASPAVALSSGAHHHVPFLIGANADETALDAPALPTEAAYQAAILAQFGGLLGPRILAQYPSTAFASPLKAWVAATTDARFVCPSRRIARAAARSQSEPVFRYFFTKSLDSTAAAALGAYHSLELPFVFGTLDKFPGFTPSPRELALSGAMNGYWARFASSGDPNGAGATPWPRYEPALDPYLDLDNSIFSGAGVRTARCDFWDQLVAPP
ncbi:MAG TPA: carboxylesterase family protein [Thermoanaerobaculia bacterium]|nr:carboxylesterase family protein [Thermoanaerobaculia bacterium]